MLKILTKAPLSYLVPNSSKPSISISLHAILSLHFHRYIFDFSEMGEPSLIYIFGVVSYILIIATAFYSLSFLIKISKARSTANVELEKLYKLKINIGIFYQLIITLMIFFGLVCKTIVN